MSISSTSRILQRVPAEWRATFEKVDKLLDIAVSLSAERDLKALLGKILSESRKITGADAGSIYVREDLVELNTAATAKDPIRTVTPRLVFKSAQNDSVSLPFKEQVLDVNARTISGYVATTGKPVNEPDVYVLPDGRPYSYNQEFDRKSGYRCKSILAVPLLNRAGEVLGVIQHINKKSNPALRLEVPEVVEWGVKEFDEEDQALLQALGSQAAICIENARLYGDIELMFEGLVRSFTHALEKRNKTTFGHCERVAKYAIGIAEAINAAGPERFGGLRFTEEQMKELRYAALLHDIGKIAVPEAVLDKRNKLTDSELQAVEYRFAYWRERLAREGKPGGFLDGWLTHVRKVNVPRGMSDEDGRLLLQIAAAKFVDLDGQEKPLLTASEYENLAVSRGNLTKGERRKIEAHIDDTWHILRHVPWPAFVERVPNIAASHHEKIDGSGYPWKLKGDEVPLGGQILAIVDIYEALTAKDRPYKAAMPVEKALAIVQEDVDRGALNRKIFELFKSQKLYLMFSDNTGFVARPAEPVLPPVRTS